MRFKFYITGCLVTTLWGCSIPKQTQVPDTKPLPGRFNGQQIVDTGSLAAIPYRQFFPEDELVQLIDTAINNNPDMQMALQRINIASAYLKTAKGAFLPTITADATASGTHFGKYTMEGVGNYDTNLSNNIDDDQKVNESFTPNFWLGINTSWEIDVWGKLKNRKQAAVANYLATQEAKNVIQTTLVSQLAGLYYTIKGLDQEYKVMNANLILQKKALDNVQALMDGGRATQLAIQQFKAQYLNTQNASTEVLRRRVEAENQINALAGRFKGSIPMDTASQSLLRPVDSIKLGFPLRIMENRPDIRESAYQLAASKANLKAARQAFFPSLTISGYTALNAFKSSLFLDGSSFAYSLLGGLSAPVLQQNKLKAEFNIATAEQQNAFQQYQKNILQGFQEVSTSLNNFESAKKMLALKSQEADALEKGVENANDLYVGGYAGYLEIIQAQKSLIQAQVEEVQIRRDILLALVDMYKSVGGGWRTN